MADRKDIVPVSDMRGFFREQVATARNRQRLKIDEHTEFYLVNLLAEFAHTEQLYEVEEDGRRRETPLVLLLARAMEQPPAERLKTLRRMGDQSLYVSGFFSDTLARSLVDVDYYIAMGGRAYEGAAELTGTAPVSRTFTFVFEELSEKFARVVDVFMEVSETLRTTRSADLVRTYERWLSTGSERLARRLADEGIVVGRRRRDRWVH